MGPVYSANDCHTNELSASSCSSGEDRRGTKPDQTLGFQYLKGQALYTVFCMIYTLPSFRHVYVLPIFMKTVISWLT